MPHLSPMNWITVPIILVSMLSVLMIIMWWQISPRFPSIYNLSTTSTLSKVWRWW